MWRIIQVCDTLVLGNVNVQSLLAHGIWHRWPTCIVNRAVTCRMTGPIVCLLSELFVTVFFYFFIPPYWGQSSGDNTCKHGSESHCAKVNRSCVNSTKKEEKACTLVEPSCRHSSTQENICFVPQWQVPKKKSQFKFILHDKTFRII